MSGASVEPELIAEMAAAIRRRTRSGGDFPSAVAGLTLHRRDAPTEPLHCIYSLGLSVVVQGSKQIMLGDDVLAYDSGYCMLSTIDHPVISHVRQASPAAPFLAAMLCLDAQAIVDAAAQMQLPPVPRDIPYRAVSIERLESTLADAFLRLIRVLDEPLLMPSLAPLIQAEIIVRLLAGRLGIPLRQMVAAGTPTQQIARAVAWLKQHFSRQLRVDELADSVQMSPSTFRHHFRLVTGVSPLQFQKQLRLQEARQLMFNQHLDAGRASALVGYESASQFSREYRRAFGAPPRRDIRRMRQGEPGLELNRGRLAAP